MFSLPLFYFLYLFYVAIGIWLIISLIGLSHLLTHSNNDKKAPIVALGYVAVSIGLFILFFSLTANIDWTQDFKLTLPANSSQNIIQ